MPNFKISDHNFIRHDLSNETNKVIIFIMNMLEIEDEWIKTAKKDLWNACINFVLGLVT